MAKKTWERPVRVYGGKLRKLSSMTHRSCWDCENLRQRGFPARKCLWFKKRHIYSPGPADDEVYAEEEQGRTGTVADRCSMFEVAREFNQAVFVMQEEVA